MGEDQATGSAVAGERNLAARMKHERTLRGWSPADLARRMTDVGCPIHTSAIYKIEDGDPPRKISVDELIGLSRVFSTSIDNLLTPMDVLGDQRARELLDRLTQAEGRLVRSSWGYVAALARLFDAAVFDPDSWDFVMFRREALSRRGGDPDEPLFAGRFLWHEEPSGRPIPVDGSAMGKGLVPYIEALTEQARQLAAAKVNGDIESGWRPMGDRDD